MAWFGSLWPVKIPGLGEDLLANHHAARLLRKQIPIGPAASEAVGDSTQFRIGICNVGPPSYKLVYKPP